MVTEPAQQLEEKPFRFSMRALLLVTTGFCILVAILARTLEPRYQIGVWIVIVFNAMMAVWTFRRYQKEMVHPD